MDNSVDKFPYFFAKTPISASFLPVKTQNRISFSPRIGSFIASKRIAWQIVAEIFRCNRFFCEIGISALLEKHCSNDAFYRKTAVSPTGTAVPEKQGIRVRLRSARSFYSRFTTRKNAQATACQRLPESCSAPSGRAKPRFSLLFRERPVSFGTEKTPQRKNGTATRTAENSHDRTIFLVSPALSRSVPQTTPNISTNLCPTRSQEVR